MSRRFISEIPQVCFRNFCKLVSRTLQAYFSNLFFTNRKKFYIMAKTKYTRKATKGGSIAFFGCFFIVFCQTIQKI